MLGFRNRTTSLLVLLIFPLLFACLLLAEIMGSKLLVLWTYHNIPPSNVQSDIATPSIIQILQPQRPSTPAVVSLLVVGDWGGTGAPPYSTAIQRSVAKAMGWVAENESVAAVLSPGDVMYDLYNPRDSDKRFRWTFEMVYTHPSLNIPWYIVAGNHDHHIIRSMIQYTNISKRWVFPAAHYVVKINTYPLNSQNLTVTIVMIDTWKLCGGGGWSPSGSQKVKSLWTWIKSTLKKNRSTYLFVVGHYPTLSIGLHGPTPCLRRLVEMMARFKANAFFAGHDHNLQHITSFHEAHNWTVHHFVVGAGAKACGRKIHQYNVPKQSQKFFYSPSMKGTEGGFGILKLYREGGEFSFRNTNNLTLYKVKLLPRVFTPH